MLEITFLGAAFAGLLSFLSPCILPIVPFYLSYLAGVGMNQITADGPVDAAVRRRAVIAALFFAAGVITIFVGLGAVATTFGQIVRDYFDILRWVAAAVIIAMGLHFLGVIRIGFLYRQFRADAGNTTATSFLGAYVIGLAFAFGWTPCVGPVLAAILFTAAGRDGGLGRAVAADLRRGYDRAFRAGGAVHRAVHALDGGVPATSGHGRKGDGGSADCLWPADRHQLDQLYCAVDA